MSPTKLTADSGKMFWKKNVNKFLLFTQRQKDETLDVDETAQWAASTAESIKDILNLCLFSGQIRKRRVIINQILLTCLLSVLGVWDREGNPRRHRTQYTHVK